MPDPECKGSIVGWDAAKALVAANSRNDEFPYGARVNQTLYLSDDDGISWSRRLTVDADSGYSTLAMVADGNSEKIANLYEAEAHDQCRMRLALLNPEELEDVDL